MPCVAAVRGKTDVQLPWSDLIDNDPCAKGIVTTVNAVDVSGENLCLLHWIAKHGQADIKGVVTLEGGQVIALTLTTNGVEPRDALRYTGVTEGDGREAESTFGFWRDSGNQLLRSSFEVATTGYTSGGTNTLARVNNNPKFGAWHVRVTYVDSLDLLLTPLTGVTALQKHWASIWVRIPSSWDGGQIQIETRDFAGGSRYGQVNADMSIRDRYQRIWEGQTPVSGDMAGTFAVSCTSPPSAGKYIDLDGAQWERSNDVPTPYIFTEGVAVGRLGGLARMPVAGIVDATEGWFAGKFRCGFSTAIEPAGSPRVWNWYDSDNDRLEMYYQVTDDRMCMRRKGAGLGNEAQQVYPVNFGDIITLLGTWSASELRISINGSAFYVTPNTNIPAMVQANIQIGSWNNGNNAASLGEMFWAAAGRKGSAWTNTQAAQLAALTRDPGPHDFPNAAVLSFLWTCDTPIAYRY